MTEPRAEPVEQFVGHAIVGSIDQACATSRQKPASGNSSKKVSISSAVRPVAFLSSMFSSTSRVPSGLIGVKFRQGIRVRDDGSDPERKLGQLMHERRLVETLVLDGRMHADIAERQPWLSSEERDQPRQLVP